MPKEIVREAYGHPWVEGDPEARQGLVQIGWSAEAGDVQIVTFARHPETHETKWEGFYVTLDRRGINDLIRYLRRARDQAYGKDE